MSDATTAPLVKTANDLSATVESIQQQLAALLQTPYNEVSGRLQASDRAKFQVMLAYTLNSLFWVYLKMQGDAPEKHSVKRELDRIRSYIVKIQETENPPKPTMTIDKEAAARFIKHNLPQLVEKSKDASNEETTPGQDESVEGRNPKKQKTDEDSTTDSETSKSTQQKKKNKNGANKRKARKTQK